MTIAGKLHTVVYVASMQNTLYAIDGTSGAVLLSNLGSPVQSMHCPAGPNLGGILSTPTIDLSSQKIYLMAYTLINN